METTSLANYRLLFPNQGPLDSLGLLEILHESCQVYKNIASFFRLKIVSHCSQPPYKPKLAPYGRILDLISLAGVSVM